MRSGFTRACRLARLIALEMCRTEIAAIDVDTPVGTGIVIYSNERKVEVLMRLHRLIGAAKAKIVYANWLRYDRQQPTKASAELQLSLFCD